MKFEVGKKYKSSLTGQTATCRYIGHRRVCLETDSGELYIPPLPDSYWEPYVEKKKGWMNLYKENFTTGHLGRGHIYSSRSAADKARGVPCIACVEIEYYEGQGLGGERE